MKVSVIVATYRRPEWLVRCLDSLEAQSRHPDEIVVSCVEGDQASRQVVREWKGKALKQALCPAPDIVRQENAGLALCSGDIVCLLDDDAAAPEGWIAGIIRHFESSPRVGAVGGPVIPFVDGKPVIEECAVFAVMTWYGRRISHSTCVPPAVQDTAFLRGANMSFRRELVVSFDERLLPYWRRFEDDVCWTIREKGFRVICDPALRVFHGQAGRSGGAAEKDRHTIIGLHHNSLYVKLKHTRGLTRAVCCIWDIIWGDDTAPGLLQILVHGTAHPRSGVLRTLGPAWAGKSKALVTFVSRREEVVCSCSRDAAGPCVMRRD